MWPATFCRAPQALTDHLTCEAVDVRSAGVPGQLAREGRRARQEVDPRRPGAPVWHACAGGYCLAGAVVSNLMVTAPVVLYCVFRVLESEHAVVTHPWVNGILRLVTVPLGRHRNILNNILKYIESY